MGGIGALALVAAACAAVIAVLVGRAYPFWSVAAFVLTLMFTPYWLGVNVSYFYVNVQILTSIAVIAALATLQGRESVLRVPDLVVLIAVVLVVLAHLSFGATLNSEYTVLSQWVPPYIVGRLASTRVDLTRLANVMAVSGALAGAAAVIEFATDYNVWSSLLPMANSQYSGWGPEQYRGSLVRAEAAFGHSIALGCALAISGVFVLWSSLRPRWRLVCLCLIMGGTAVTLSRIGIITLSIGLLVGVLVSKDPRIRAMRWAVIGIVAAGALATVVAAWSSFTSDEASDSADYRSWILELIPSVRPLGLATSALRTADGTLLFGSFRSIDSELLFASLQYGWLPTVLLASLVVAATLALLRPSGRTPARLALAAQIPALVSVALITQYGMLLFFIAGLAVAPAVAEHDEFVPIRMSKRGLVP